MTRRIVLGGGAALVVIGALTGCSPTTEKEAPTTRSATTPPSSSRAPSVTPTEKAVGPGNTNSFSPGVDPNPPGAICKSIVNGVCQR